MFGSVIPHWEFSSVQSCGFLENSPTLLHFCFYWLISAHVKDSLSWEITFPRMTIENIREMLPINAPLIPYAYFHHPIPSSLIWFFSSVQFSRSVVSNSLQLHELQHTRPPFPSPTPGVYSNPCQTSRWCHPTISSSVVPFSSYLQSLPASGSFPMSQLFTWGGQSIEVSASASVLLTYTQDWFTLGWTGWMSLQSKGLSRVFSNTIVNFFSFFLFFFFIYFY